MMKIRAETNTVELPCELQAIVACGAAIDKRERGECAVMPAMPSCGSEQLFRAEGLLEDAPLP